MNGRYFQFAVLHLLGAGTSAGLFCSLTFAPLLIGLVAGLPLDAAEAPSAPTPSAEAAPAQLQGVRFSSESSRTRVVIDLSADVRYKVGHLSNPERLYFDLQQTQVSPRMTSRQITLQDEVVDQIRIGVAPGPVTRVVFDLHSAVRYRISALNDPARMLVELDRSPDAGGLAQSVRAAADEPDAPTQGQARTGTNSLTGFSEQVANLRDSSSQSEREAGPQTYGKGEKGGLNYAGTTAARNLLLFGLDFGTSYDDNIFGRNAHKVGDAEFLVGPSLSLRREGSRVALALSYQPHFRIYRNASELNTLDHQLAFDASYRATSRLSFRGRTSATYLNGLFQPGQNEESLSGLTSPSLNQTLYTPTARQLSFSSRVDASYQVAPHDSVDLYAGQSLLNFEQQIPNEGGLQNTREIDAGLIYEHRISPHATLGLDYLFQKIDFGANSGTRVHSGFLSYAQQLSPSVTFSVFGGPQHSDSNEILSLALGPFLLQIPIAQAGWNWALGGTLTKQLNTTVFQVTAQHQVSNGGGLLGAVVGTSAGISVRRRLPGHWDAAWSGSYAKNANLISGGPASDYQSETAGFSLARPITDKMSLRVGYDFLHQRGTGQSPIFGEIDRDLVSIQFSYRFHQISLGQ